MGNTCKGSEARAFTDCWRGVLARRNQQRVKVPRTIIYGNWFFPQKERKGQVDCGTDAFVTDFKNILSQ